MNEKNDMNINEFEKFSESQAKMLEKINDKIRRIENALQSAYFPDITFLIKGGNFLEWSNTEQRFLCFYEAFGKRPLIEHKAKVRIEIYPYLNNFMSEICREALNENI